MDLPSPPATPRDHITQKLSTKSAQTSPPILDARSYKSDRLRESSKSNSMALKRRSKSEENLTTLMQRNVFRNSQRSLSPAQPKSMVSRPSVIRRHSSCVEMNSRDTMRIATIYGWVTSDVDYANPSKSSPLIVLSNVDMNSRNRRRATTDQLLSSNNSIHPLDKLEDNQKYIRQRTQSSGWTELSTKSAKPYQEITHASRRRSLYATRSATQPTLSTTGKFSKLLIRRRKLGRIPMSKSLPSLLVTTSTDAGQGLPPFPHAHHKYSTEQVPSLPSSSASFKRLQKNANGSRVTARKDKTESIIDVLLAAANVPENDANDMRKEETIHDEVNEASPNVAQVSTPPPERPLPPVENDPRVFDVLEKVNTCVINYITPTQTVGGELVSSTMERVGSTPTAGAVISAATIEKLIEKLTRDIDTNFLLDFFLTYRQFMSPVKLCKWLMLRFRWAVMEETEVRRIVRIRTFVVLRYWMTYFWVQDFKPSRTLRFILSTFLSQLRAHPAVEESDRDSRIIRNLRNIFKKQRKLHLSDEMQLSLSRDSAILDNDTIAEEPEFRHEDGLRRRTKDSRKDSAIGMPSSHHKHSISLDNTREPKSSLSTPVVPILKRSRRMSENSQRGVNDSNEWAARLTFGLRSVKRTVPAMYRSLVEGFHGNNTPDITCKCDDFRQESRISQGSTDDMMDLQSYKNNSSKSATLNSSYRSRRVGKSSSHIEKSSVNELRLYAPRPRPSQSLTEPPRNYSELSIGNSDMYQQPHPNPACPYHLSISSPNVASPPNISFLPSTVSKAKSFSTDMENSIHSGFRIDTQSNITLRHPQKPFILQHRSEVIMQQFCIIEKELLERVTWVEIVEMRWKKTRAPVSQRSGEGNSNVLDCNIDAVIEWFNITYVWVISEILSIQSLEVRVQVIEKFIRIALKCYHHRNYSTLLQILLALQSPHVSRLNKTWNRVDQYERQIFERLKDLPNPERNWKRVRNCMISAVEAVAETQAVEAILSDDGPDQPMFLSQRGSIPFLGLYLADMTSNAEMPTFIPNSAAKADSAPSEDNNGTQDLVTRLAKTPLVNFNKFRITASVVKHVLAFQLLAKCYQFERYDSVYDYLKHMVFMDNNDMREASFQCEE